MLSALDKPTQFCKVQTTRYLGVMSAMKPTLLSFCLITFAAALAAEGAQAAGHTIQHAGDKPSVVGSATMFTGKVRQDSVARADEFSKSGITYVTFEPGARTLWHTHPAGQRLLIVSGKGLVGTADGRTDVVRAGDYVWCPPDVSHWHGATPDTAMVHIALTNSKNGKTVHWQKPVTDEEYAELAAKAVDPIKK